MIADSISTLNRYCKKIFAVISDPMYQCTIRKQAKLWKAANGEKSLRFDYDLNQNSTVLDVGGYEGQWASDIYSRYRCRIYVFEPAKNFAESIKKRFAQNPNIRVLQFGLGGSSRKEIINLCNDGSSIFRNSHYKEEIEIVDVSNWIQSENISEIDLMKVNIEGGEYELLEKLIETGLIRTIRNIQVQFHNIKKGSRDRIKHIQKCLEATHYPTYQYTFIWENWARKER